MRWFKHFSDNYRGRSINYLHKKMGHTGIACYYLLLEICTEKMEKDQEQSLDKGDCVLVLDANFVRTSLKTSANRVLTLLGHCQDFGLIEFRIFESDIEIKIPMLWDLLDYDSKRSRARRARAGLRPRLYTETYASPDVAPPESETYAARNASPPESEVYIKKSILVPETKSLVPKKKQQPNPDNLKIWQAYFTAYNERYNVDPVRNAAVNKQISNLRERLGVTDAIAVVEFFLKHNDSFYLKGTHSIGLCLRDCESLRTQMLRNQPITHTLVRSFEKQNQTKETIDLVEIAIKKKNEQVV